MVGGGAGDDDDCGRLLLLAGEGATEVGDGEDDVDVDAGADDNDDADADDGADDDVGSESCSTARHRMAIQILLSP